MKRKEMRNYVFLFITMVFVCAIDFSFAQDSKKSKSSQVQEYEKVLQAQFEKKSAPGEFSVSLSRHIISRGDSVFCKIEFPPIVDRIVIEGVGETTREDIKKGIWITTLKTDSTRYFVYRMFKGNTPITRSALLVTVVEPEEYETVIKKLLEFEANKDWSGLSRYKRDISGGRDAITYSMSLPK